MTGHPKVVHRRSADFIRVLKPLETNLGGELRHLFTQDGDRGDELGHLLVDALFFHQLGDQLAELAQCGAVVTQDLSSQQVQGLDRVSTFIDHVDAVIPHKLLHAPFLDEAMPAENLHTGIGRNVAVVGEKSLDDGSQHRQHLTRIFALLFVGVVVFFFQ